MPPSPPPAAEPHRSRVNIVDVAVALLAVAAVALVVSGYLLFRVPGRPQIASVEPRTVVSGDDARVVLRGQRFLPFFRVFLERSGDSAQVSHEIRRSEASDEFTLSNRAQARFVVESPALAELWIPEGTRPGVYDLALYDETRQVAVLRQAVTVVPSVLPPAAEAATVLASGWFVGFTAAAASELKVGMKVPADDERPWGEIVSLEPPVSGVMRLQVGPEFVNGAVEDRVQVPATLRLTCVPADGRCRVGDVYIAAQTPLPVPFAGRTVPFFIDVIDSDAGIRAVTARVRARFVVPAEVASMMRPGDLDEIVALSRDVRRPAARVVSLSAVRTAARGELPDDAARAGGAAGLVAVDAALSVPVRVTPEEMRYRGRVLKPGVMLTFTTRGYTAEGWVLAVEPVSQGEAAQ
jgi:hypothetical protein